MHTFTYIFQNGNKKYVPGTEVAYYSRAIDPPEEKGKYVIRESWYDMHEIIMSYDNYVSLLCEIDRQGKEIDELKKDIDLIKNINPRCSKKSKIDQK